MNEINPPAIVREHSAAVELIREVRALDAEVKQDVARAVHGIRKMGEKLCEAKAKVGHGKWREFLAATMPETSYRTVRRWMRTHKMATVAILNEQIRAVTHAEDDEVDDDEDDGFGPGDPTADRGDAYEGDDEPAQPAAPRTRKSTQSALDLDPEETKRQEEAALAERAKERAAGALSDLRLRVEEVRDLTDEVCWSAVGDEFQRQCRLSSVELRQTPPTDRQRAAFRLAVLDEMLRVIDRARSSAGLPAPGAG